MARLDAGRQCGEHGDCRLTSVAPISFSLINEAPASPFVVGSSLCPVSRDAEELLSVSPLFDDGGREGANGDHVAMRMMVLGSSFI